MIPWPLRSLLHRSYPTPRRDDRSPKPEARATGYVEIRERKGGSVFYAKLKLPDGSQPRRRLGRAWIKRSRVPADYLTKEQAEARLHTILAGDDPFVNIAPSHVSFGQACAERLRYLEHEKQRKRSTIGDYANVIAHDLVPFFGESTPIEDVTTSDVEAFKDYLLARGVSHRTAQKVLVILQGVMSRAKRKGWTAANPCEDAEKVTVRRSDEFNVLSAEYVHAVARAARDDLPREIITLAAFTGLRMGELLALRWRHIDFGNRSVHVQRNYVDGFEDTPKSNRRRSVPLSDQAIVALDALSRREHFTGPDDLVFVSVGGEHLNADTVRHGFYTALDTAGLGHLREQDNPIVFHDLRHTFGTLLAAGGADVLRIKQWMGHADIQTTMRYLHYVPAHDDAALMTAIFNSTGGAHPADTARGTVETPQVTSKSLCSATERED